MSNNTKTDKPRDLILGSLFATNNGNRYNMIKIDGKVYDALSNIEIGGRLVVHLYDNKDGTERKRTDAIGHIGYRTKAQVEADKQFYQKTANATESDSSGVGI